MTPQEILDYNRRCAEFLGIVDNNNYLKFHSDWNRIMEVIEAIEKLGFTTSLTNKYFHIMKVHGSVGTSVGRSKINSESKNEAVVQAINEFLIWHNENK